MSRRYQMEISNAELAREVKSLDEMHRDHSYPSMTQAIDEWQGEVAAQVSEAGLFKQSLGRRRFLLGIGGTIVGGAVLAACGSSASSSTAATAAPTTTIPAGLAGDLKVAGIAASLENLGIYAYGAGISAATAGKLGAVPPAVVTFAQTAMAQHKDHAAAWNAILTGAGMKAVTSTDATLTPTVNGLFAKVTDVTGLAQLALTIEEIAAATYLEAISAMSTPKAIATAATIQPVEMQHAAILNYVLGQYPVPVAFATTTGAAKG